ncbi:acetyl-CoA/propionyl-CoA carboxylase, biotin carboxylase, biotin carboxyl carrier protein [Arthrobacter sp. yr096]|uniref:acetyl/propionyl/methylcrotonyl-CoA carboxylase subunit alpha n=1 Tax=Arthrobacter sp. yr096 TaxID=1761750 RepID=UPI0008B6EF88|nr:biotin carboxylase N-terminal domain-containing protein [Arthrobacter sp. yr096]SEJ77964.1 acetyl-CoA/propionyl-CoA carboxylase, biotin carboxylase, biotin carboxyl carrier protein [Arthrobacter sp. yr096]
MTKTPQEPIRRLLVANRGEIAVRIIRAARDRGVTSIAIYSEPDEGSKFVRLADVTVPLAGSAAAETYLNIDAILAAAKSSGADAVHPGYGFLSENAAFAEAVLAEGLTWIGPSPDAIRALGDKVTARKIAIEVGAPLAPGTPNPVNGHEDVEAFAREHGLPLAIKAAYGGGGRGIKIARKFEDIPELFRSATREAELAFGRGECFVERYLEHPRHVETQILADSHGNVIVVGTRDCSVQRRFQKLVEEAPAPFLTSAQEASMRQASRDIARAAGYVGAGTVEFLVGGDGLVSFLEVNTRLQVEHPVTEETTGIDLVNEQLNIAEGKPLSVLQDPIPSGHSIEFRINSEDPASGFLPHPGEIRRLVFPEGPGVRIDSGIEQGSTIGDHYDSLQAKIIVTGRDRQHALQRARRALAEVVIDGVPTVVPFHRSILEEPAFTANDGKYGIYTNWVDHEWVNTLPPQDTDASLKDEYRETETVVLIVNGKKVEVLIPLEFLAMEAGQPRQTEENTPRSIVQEADAQESAAGESIKAPMAGAVTRIEVATGDILEQGAVVAVMEIMKMEHPVLATSKCTVREIYVEPGQTLAKHEPIIRVESLI